MTPARPDDVSAAAQRPLDDRDSKEQDRLAELDRYDILHTPPERAFDDIVALAAQICGVPVALVSIVSADEQVFKARVGLEAPGTARDISFCDHAIRTPGIMVVPDARNDPRFTANPLVTGDLGLRFYAGVPLVTPTGHALGTLCIIDKVPRTLDTQQLHMLEVLSRQAMAQLELRRALRESESALAEAELHKARYGEAVERQREIVLEMAHRMKNTLAIVQAIVTQTFRQVATLEEGRDAVQARLAALARAQDVLTVSGDAGDVDVRSVVRAALAPHMGMDCDSRFDLDGSDVLLGSRQALGLSLGLHELATNATKYGSLSRIGGRVAIGWSQQIGADGSARFSFGWSEIGGPPVSPPARSGFGSRLVERIVPAYFEGTARLSFENTGLVFRLEGKPRGAPADS